MRIVFSLIFCIFLAAGNCFADDDYGVGADEDLKDSVTILAVSSLTAPISQLALSYSQKNNLDINTVFESSGELMRQLDNGDPADIIIFSNNDWMQNIRERGLIDPKSITKIAGNVLLLTASNKISVPQNLPLPDALDYIHDRMLMVMANPQDSALGVASKSILLKNNKWNKFEKLLVLAPSSSKTTDLIIKGQTAGIIYATDYYLRKSELELVAKIPPQDYPQLEYKGAVVIGKNMSDAHNFLKYLTSPEAQKIFKKYGFIVN